MWSGPSFRSSPVCTLGWLPSECPLTAHPQLDPQLRCGLWVRGRSWMKGLNGRGTWQAVSAGRLPRENVCAHLKARAWGRQSRTAFLGISASGGCGCQANASCSGWISPTVSSHPQCPPPRPTGETVPGSASPGHKGSPSILLPGPQRQHAHSPALPPRAICSAHHQTLLLLACVSGSHLTWIF